MSFLPLTSVKEEIVLAIVGSRHFNNYDGLKSIVDKFILENGRPAKIVSGDAKGADTLAARYANEHSFPFVKFEANWSAFGRAAGPKRNDQIVASCTHMIAFPDILESIGTEDSIRKARSARIPLHVYTVDRRFPQAEPEPVKKEKLITKSASKK